MKIRRQIKITIYLVISFAVVWTFAAVQVANASSYLPLGILASDDVIENDVFTTGPLVIIDGTVNGDVIVLGNQVQINGTINGSLFVIGQQVVVQGDVAGTTYVGAVSLELGSGTTLERSLYYIGTSLTTQPDSAIQRDLNTICLGADLNGSIGRDTRAVIGIQKLIERVIRLLGVDFLTPGINIRPGAWIPLGAAGSLASGMLLHLAQDPAPAGTIDTVRLTAWLLERLRDFGILLILGGVFYWLFRKPLNQTAQALRARPLPALGIGLLVLLITSNIFLVGLLVAGLLFVIGFWLGGLGLWDFTLAFWALTFAALAFFLAALWFLVAYGTKLIVSYLVGSWLFEKLAPIASLPPFLGLVIGLLIYVLLRSIPMLGWVLGVLVTAWGLGACWLAYRKSVAPAVTE